MRTLLRTDEDVLLTIPNKVCVALHRMPAARQLLLKACCLPSS
jgi:hypothetical protein